METQVILFHSLLGNSFYLLLINIFLISNCFVGCVVSNDDDDKKNTENEKEENTGSEVVLVGKYNDVLFFDDESLFKNIKDIVIQLLMSKQTEAVTRKMNEEILPKLRVMTERMSDKIDLQTLKEQIEDKNPEWLNTYSNDIVKNWTNTLKCKWREQMCIWQHFLL